MDQNSKQKIVKLKEKQAKCREFAIFWSILTGLSSKVEKTRQIERKSRNCPSRFKSRKKLVKLARIVEFWVSFYCSKFKSRKKFVKLKGNREFFVIKAFWRIYAKNNVKFRLLLPYELTLACFPFTFTIFSFKCKEKLGKTVDTLPGTQKYLLFTLFHCDRWCLFTSQQRGRA